MWFTVGTSVIHTFCYVLMNGFFWIAVRRGWFVGYEIPRKDAQRPKPELVRKTLREAAIGQTVTGPITAYVLYPVAKSLGVPGMLDPLPEFGTMYLAVLLAFVINDWGFYWAHRLVHTPLLYKRVHKQHHMYVGTVGFAAEYAHWFEQIAANQGPTIAGTLFFGRHMAIFWGWLVARLEETYEAHSGFSFAGTLPHRLGLTNADEAAWHDFHHTGNRGNFGAAYLDHLFGTMDAWVEMENESKQKSS